MGCRKKIAAAIREKNADYPLAVKGNILSLINDILEMSRIESGIEGLTSPDGVTEFIIG